MVSRKLASSTLFIAASPCARYTTRPNNLFGQYRSLADLAMQLHRAFLQDGTPLVQYLDEILGLRQQCGGIAFKNTDPHRHIRGGQTNLLEKAAPNERTGLRVDGQLFEYLALPGRRSRKKAKLKGYLLEEPALLFETVPVPSDNPFLKIETS